MSGPAMTLRHCAYTRCRRSFPVRVDDPRAFCDDACLQAERTRQVSQARMVRFAGLPCDCQSCRATRSGASSPRRSA